VAVRQRSLRTARLTIGQSSVGLAIGGQLAEQFSRPVDQDPLNRDGEPGPPLHAQPCTPDGFDGVGGPADFDLCRALTTEEIEQQLTRKSSDANRGFPSPGSYGIGRPSPLKLKPCAA
jgi:hypothetical protein